MKLARRVLRSSITSGNVDVAVINYSPGTYVRDSSGLITVTSNTHGFSTLNKVYIKFTSGAAVSKVFNSITVIDSNTFTVQDTDLSSASGNLLVTRLTFTRSGTYTRDTKWVITATITSHGLSKGDNVFMSYTSGDEITSPAIIERVVNSNSFKTIAKGNPGGFYKVFGVDKFHQVNNYGAGVKVYVIDEGFNDLDPLTPGIQTTTDLAEFTIVNVSDAGSGGGGLSHGGLTCALLGASRKNGSGIIGVCPDATLFLADVDNSSGDIFISNVVNAIDDAIAKNVDIINISLGTATSSTSLQQAVQRALDANILVFASAGNSGSFVYEYPAAYTGVISVASVNINRTPSNFNTKNDRVGLFAPGEDYPLPSPLDDQDVVYVDGTSFSSPFAAGMAALYVAKRRLELGNPNFRPSSSEVVAALSGEEYLNTSELSYAAPTNPLPASEAGLGMALVGGLLVVLLIGLIALSPSRRRPIIQKND